VKIRAYRPGDRAALARMYQEGVDYSLDELSKSQWFSKLVLENDEGKVVMATLARRTCEVHCMVDHTAGTPKERYRAFEALHVVTERVLRSKGMADGFCVLANTPRLRRFGRRLMKLGWLQLWSFWFPIKE